MMDYIKKYTNQLEPRIIFYIGFLLSFPVALVATNSIPRILPFKVLAIISIAVWIILFFIKPIKSYLLGLFMVIQYLWVFSIVAVLPPYLQDGVESLLPGGVKSSVFIYDHLFGKYFDEFITYVKDLLMRNVNGENEFYLYVFVTAIILLIMALVMKLVEKRVDWKIFLGVSVYFVIAWFIYVSKLQGYFSLFFIGLTLYKQFMIYEDLVKDAKGSGERTRYYNYSSAILVGFFIMVTVIVLGNIIMFMAPVEKINESIHNYVPSVGGIRSDFVTPSQSKIFSFNSTMYSPNENMLGGPITERDYTVVMRVKSDEGSQYLRGRSKNVYDGTKWLSDFDTYHNNIYKNVEIPPEHLAEMQFYPETLSTRTLFSPYRYYKSSFIKVDVFGNEDQIVYRKSTKSINLERYSVEYIKPEFVHLYDTLPDELRQNYLDLPSRGLTKTRDLTEEITEGLTDPYEIMKTMERYLRDNYRYTLDTSEVIENEDFVEQFLFEEEQGYCTYFATSLAVMGRMADIPTRYIEGFITTSYRDFEGYYEVSANHAHAWVEAYIEGQGWVRFEPTPAYQNGDEVEAREIFVEGSDDFDGSLDASMGDRIEEEIFENNLPIAEEETVNVMDVVMIALYAGLIISVLLLIAAKIKRMRKDIHDGQLSEKINRRIHYILSMCRIIDDDIDTSELPKHVIMKNAETLQLEVSDQVKALIDASLYSKKSFSEDDFQVMDTFFIAFEDKVKIKVTRFGHFMYKVMLNNLYHKDYYN